MLVIINLNLNKIMFYKNSFVIVSLLSLFGLIVLTASASTTISTDINTGGTLTVTGASTLTGAVTATGGVVSGANITVPAAYGLDSAAAGVLNIGTTTATTINIGGTQATTKVLGLFQVPAAYGIDTSAAGVLNIGTTTATTINIGGTQATMKVLGLFQVPAAYGIDVAAAGVLNIGTTTANAITIGKSGITTTFPGAVTISGAASSTSIKVGSDQVSTISGMIFGTCNLVTVSVTATSTAFTTCTGATGVVSSLYNAVFVSATSSLPAGLIIDAASTTLTSGTLSLRINNVNAGANTNTGAISVNFWALR